MIRFAWRLGFLVLIALAGWRAWSITAYESEFNAGTRAYAGGRYRESLERLERARRRADADPLLWTWIGDAAGAVRRNPPAGGWPAAESKGLHDRMWSGYAGAVLRRPRDSWSWTGLAEAALDSAAETDLARGVDLSEIGRRSRGELDPWRAIALGAAELAVELEPSGYLELDTLAAVYAACGQTERATKTYVHSARMMPAPSFHESWSRPHAFAPSVVGEILQGLRTGLANAPEFDRCRLHLEIGRFALAHGELVVAREEMGAAEKSATTDNERYHAARGMAQTLEARGDFEEALAAWDRVSPTGLATPGDRRQRGVVLSRLGRHLEACRSLRDASGDLPGDTTLRVAAASACEEADDLDSAERILRDGFTDPVEDPTMARGLYEFYVRTGKRSTAARLARNWARDHPDRADFQSWADALSSEGP